jgi:hypothetical protein
MVNRLLFLSNFTFGLLVYGPNITVEGAELGSEESRLETQNSVPAKNALAWFIPPWGKHRGRLEQAGLRF